MCDRLPHVVHLTSSRFFGGPERQILELARELAPDVNMTLLSFSEGGLCQQFLEKAREQGCIADALRHDTPRLIAAVRELKRTLANRGADVLVCHGYKANLLGLCAARWLGIRAVAVARGWTAESWKVRLYEALDRRVLRRMDKVVCVSEGQAQKIRKAGVPKKNVTVIHNSIRADHFAGPPNPVFRHRLESMFSTVPTHIIGAAGRLSPEKGFNVLIEACAQLHRHDKLDSCIALFGEGILHDELQQQINAAGLADRFVLAGFTDQLDCYMPHFDVFVQSSYSEGLPNVLLEAAAAGVPVVATDVGGTAEVVKNEETGLLVPPGDTSALAGSLRRLLEDAALRHDMQTSAPAHVAGEFTFARQAEEYRKVFNGLVNSANSAT